MRPKYHSCNTKNTDSNQKKLNKDKICVTQGTSSKWLHGSVQPCTSKKFRKKRKTTVVFLHTFNKRNIYQKS